VQSHCLWRIGVLRPSIWQGQRFEPNLLLKPLVVAFNFGSAVRFSIAPGNASLLQQPGIG